MLFVARVGGLGAADLERVHPPLHGRVPGVDPKKTCVVETISSNLHCFAAFAHANSTHLKPEPTLNTHFPVFFFKTIFFLSSP